jgi:hypothetical protein
MIATLAAALITLHVSPNHLASAGIDVPVVESSLAVDPGDPKHLVGVAIAGEDPGPETTCATFLSRDGGATWTSRRLPVAQCGDPWAIIGPKQTIVTVLAGAPALGFDDGFLVFRSGDGGATWPLPPQNLARHIDHDTLFADTRDPANPRLFALGMLPYRVEGHRRVDVFLARSDDWITFPRVTRVTPSNLNFNTFTGAVLRDGTVVVSYGDFMPLTKGPKARLEKGRVWLLTSRDGGETFGAPLLIGEGCTNQFPILAADPADDTLYFTCATPDEKQLFLYRSRDKGESWTEPLPVPAAPGETSVRGANIATGKNGALLVTWMSETDAAKHCNALWATASADGGDTFAKPVRVSEGAPCNDTPRNAKMLKRFDYGGDYFGLAADRDGVFQLIWSDSRNGVYQLWSASVTVVPTTEQKETKK